MSNLDMSPDEMTTINVQLEPTIQWAAVRNVEAEQLAMDSARLLSCTDARLDKLVEQGFFRRCWSRFSGEATELENANSKDLIQMQKCALRYISLLEEQQIMAAHTMLTMKNNLLSLSIKEEETRKLVEVLARRTLERFEKLEDRLGQVEGRVTRLEGGVEQLEISSYLQNWVFTLEEREYKEKIPAKYMRLLKVINDFYSIKNDAWNSNDLLLMRKALRTVGIDPTDKISINTFIDSLVDEILLENVGFKVFSDWISLHKPIEEKNYSKFAIENISSPIFTTIHGLKVQYIDKSDVVEELEEEMNISTTDALKRLLKRSIRALNINLDYEFSLAETAIEILACIRLCEKIYASNSDTTSANSSSTAKPIKFEISATNLSPASNLVKNNESFIVSNISNMNSTKMQLEMKLNAYSNAKNYRFEENEEKREIKVISTLHK